MTPINDGIAIRDVVLPAQGFTDAQLRSAFYDLTASPEQADLLLEDCTPEDADAILNPGQDLVTEAVSTVKNRIDRTMSAVARVLKRYASDDVTPYDMPSIGPDRKNSLFAYKTVTFTFSDGQTVSILFHSPGSDPMKLRADDTLIAYRWMLNKRDITATVSPEGGRDIDINTMGKRIMQLVSANSEKFKANNAKRQEQQAKLDDLQSQQAEKSQRVDALTQENADLTKQVEAADARIEKLRDKLADLGEGSRDGSGAGAGSGRATREAEQSANSPEQVDTVDGWQVSTGPFVDFTLTAQSALGVDSTLVNVTSTDGTAIGTIDRSDLDAFIRGDVAVFTPVDNWEAKFSQSLKEKMGLAEPSGGEPTPPSDLAALDQRLARDIAGSIGMVMRIDNGEEPGMNRSAFTSSIAGKIKTQARNGNTEIVDAILLKVAKASLEHSKPVLAARNAAWKANGHDMDYYLEMAKGQAGGGEGTTWGDEKTSGSESGETTDPNIGREWGSEWGRQRIVEREQHPTGDMYLVETVDGEKIGQQRKYPVEGIDETIRRQEYKLTDAYQDEQRQAEEDRRLREERDQRQAAERDAQNAEIQAFADSRGMSTPGAAKARDALLVKMRFDGSVMTRKKAIEGVVADGGTITGEGAERRLMMGDGSFYEQKTITKTGMDYAEYLISQRTTGEETTVTDTDRGSSKARREAAKETIAPWRKAIESGVSPSADEAAAWAEFQRAYPIEAAGVKNELSEAIGWERFVELAEGGKEGGESGTETDRIRGELQSLIDSETDTGVFDQRLDELADEAEKADAMDELDDVLNAAADRLTELLNQEAANVA